MTTHPSKRLVSFMHFTSCPIITTAWDPQGPACAEMFALSCISHPALRLRRDSSCQAPEWFGGGGGGRHSEKTAPEEVCCTAPMHM